ncbi:hypothetical protein LTS18_007692 [Coniosporium uncinatum]|uniref:Uncharacterized protein n=1 Tax=Coniosporium uncinatum TaxID=93489 RepID=A0ACC3DNY6_9PEZI|nr:hypothetical protein LTS18_007692 [Coniosporium uncinatum]
MFVIEIMGLVTGCISCAAGVSAFVQARKKIRHDRRLELIREEETRRLNEEGAEDIPMNDIALPTNDRSSNQGGGVKISPALGEGEDPREALSAILIKMQQDLIGTMQSLLAVQDSDVVIEHHEEYALDDLAHDESIVAFGHSDSAHGAPTAGLSTSENRGQVGPYMYHATYPGRRTHDDDARSDETIRPYRRAGESPPTPSTGNGLRELEADLEELDGNQSSPPESFGHDGPSDTARLGAYVSPTSIIAVAPKKLVKIRASAPTNGLNASPVITTGPALPTRPVPLQGPVVSEITQPAGKLHKKPSKNPLADPLRCPPRCVPTHVCAVKRWRPSPKRSDLVPFDQDDILEIREYCDAKHWHAQNRRNTFIGSIPRNRFRIVQTVMPRYFVRALQDIVSADRFDLQAKAGDVIAVLAPSRRGENWACGSLNWKNGPFPLNPTTPYKLDPIFYVTAKMDSDGSCRHPLQFKAGDMIAVVAEYRFEVIINQRELLGVLDGRIGWLRGNQVEGAQN